MLTESLSDTCRPQFTEIVVENKSRGERNVQLIFR